jgi:hypothetical protein
MPAGSAGSQLVIPVITAQLPDKSGTEEADCAITELVNFAGSDLCANTEEKQHKANAATANPLTVGPAGPFRIVKLLTLMIPVSGFSIRPAYFEGAEETVGSMTFF